jgi:hypothetical protein
MIPSGGNVTIAAQHAHRLPSVVEPLDLFRGTGLGVVGFRAQSVPEKCDSEINNVH